MADFGEFGGPIKDYLGSQTISAPDASNISTVITDPRSIGSESNKTMTCLITTSHDVKIEINEAATDANSLAIGSSDTLIIKLASGATLGAFGKRGGSAVSTVTVKKYVS